MDAKATKAAVAVAWARTALDDPGAIDVTDEDFREAVETSDTLDRIYAEAAPNPYMLYAIGKLDEALALLRRPEEEDTVEHETDGSQ